MRHPLSAEQVAHYRREGYVVLERLFDAPLLREIDRTIDAVTREALAGGDYSKILELEPETLDGKRVPRRIYHPFERHETFRKLATDERLLDGVESLIGGNFDCQHSKLNMKPPHIGSAVEWHQDLAYFPHTNDDIISCLIYLDDASLHNGCLQVLPRHHHHFFDHTAPDGHFAGMITEDLSNNRFGKPVPIEAPAGSAILMHCVTPHSSLPNRSDKPRRTFIFEFRATDSFPIYYGDDTAAQESHGHLIRGKPSRYARFAGPPPYIPNMDKRFTSLYQLQAENKARVQPAAV
ncbi:MAG: phytanoyl-CoA dioxygenase family protein [Planctomycetes bacterium]|nr:phytanoyl-CoA dioxygenase family protein [Planctomycetota bacterium]